jgi:hypothetical protein
MRQLSIAILACLVLTFGTGLNGCGAHPDAGRYQVQFFPPGATSTEGTRVFVIDTKTGRKVELSYAQFVETTDLSSLFPSP